MKSDDFPADETNLLLVIFLQIHFILYKHIQYRYLVIFIRKLLHLLYTE